MKITVLGAAGRMGQLHARHLIEMGHEVHAVDPAILGMPDSLKSQVTFGEPGYTDPWWTREYDGVVVASPAEGHIHSLNRAVTARKHVFVEKPICLIGQTEKMRETLSAADLCGLIVATGYNLRFHPAVMRVKDAIASGEFKPMWGSFMLRQKPARPLAHFLEEWASHEVDLAMHLLGPALGSPDKVVDAARHLLVGIDVMIDHKNDTRSFIHADAETEPFRRAFTLVDQDGRSITCDIETGHVQEAHYKTELTAWLWRIKTGAMEDKRLATGWDGLAVIELLERLVK